MACAAADAEHTASCMAQQKPREGGNSTVAVAKVSHTAAGVLILSEFTGASQSLGAGAILVNPWNITDLSAAIGDALTMTDAERRERHRQNYMHISIHTSQTWADTFISELNDTHVEAELRTKHIPPQVGSMCHAALCCHRAGVWYAALLGCAVLCWAVLC